MISLSMNKWLISFFEHNRRSIEKNSNVFCELVNITNIFIDLNFNFCTHNAEYNCD